MVRKTLIQRFESARRLHREDIVRGLIVPGLNGSGPTHWQSLWARQYEFERVEQHDWANPDAAVWVEALDAVIRAQSEKVTIIAHSLGCWTTIHWAMSSSDSGALVESALLVAPPDIPSSKTLPKSAIEFLRHQKVELPFPSILVGSENDPYMALNGAQILAQRLGSRFINAGFAGHINIDSGHGPWSEGESLLHELIDF
jgi:uncharacterized protein